MQSARIRQQPGFACEECRRRKSRCDRVRPRCGACTEYGTACITMDKRPRRGPKKGQIEMMRSRIATLEWELRKHSGRNKQDTESPTSDVVAEVSAAAPPEPLVARPEQTRSYADMDTLPDSFVDEIQPYFAWPMAMTMPEAAGAVATTGRLDIEGSLNSSSQLSAVFGEQHELGDVNSVMEPRDPAVSDPIRADLDDVYFDRVHKFCPMVHQQRYFSWARQKNPSTARACLRSAMRTVAAAMSAPYRSCANVLYAESRHLLEESRRANDAPGTHWLAPFDKIEYVQAWILLAHYESLRVNKWQAMMTAGHAFRLIQMIHLHEIDLPRTAGTPPRAGFQPNESFAETEEKRRTFWVAYTLDYFLCWRSGWPLTLYEDMISTRLPAPEENFQNSQPIVTDYLADAIARGEPTMLSLFSECIVLATLHSRCMAHSRTASRYNSQESPDSVKGRHESLAADVEIRVKLLGQSRTTPTLERDHMLFFIHMLAHSAIICLGGAVQKTWPWQAIENWEQRASKAVAEMLRLVKALPSFNCFNSHPFLPNPLASGIAFLNPQQGSLGDDADVGAEILLQMLRDLRDVNNIAHEIC
ncbi:fungal-specific transcription factor domain-containing protein [Xylariaceae sp. FL0662B]|nr:fungal-specific transcription factor domain-containing protein [Xylariaceae sp. FL0662B]